VIDKKKEFKIEQGDGTILHRIRLESEKCERDTERSFYVIQQIFKELNLQPNLMNCGGYSFGFQDAKISHNDDRWVLIFTAIVRDNL